MGSGYRTPLDCKNLQVRDDIWQVFTLKELYYQTIGGDFFFLKNAPQILQAPQIGVGAFIATTSVDRVLC